ncbi:hypothetical protein LWI29_000815 [Acer saccharum]|uniref:Uncharacterized protein n=1 Tax=Acer saccharum TaxID=4024 RepID=A0AA39VK07_ACESA|nr:hypothetical protein LWI29_000815 [Acer saccharum]
MSEFKGSSVSWSVGHIVEVNIGRWLSNRRRKAPVSSSLASHDLFPSFLPLFFFFLISVWLVQLADASSPASGQRHPHLVADVRFEDMKKRKQPEPRTSTVRTLGVDWAAHGKPISWWATHSSFVWPHGLRTAALCGVVGCVRPWGQPRDER